MARAAKKPEEEITETADPTQQAAEESEPELEAEIVEEEVIVEAVVAEEEEQVEAEEAAEDEATAEELEEAEYSMEEIQQALEDLIAAIERHPVVADVKKAVAEARAALASQPGVAKVRKAVQDTAAEFQGTSLKESAHKVLLAGIGAAALTIEEIEAFTNRLVERGQMAESDGKKMLSDVMERRKKMAEQTDAELRTRVQDILSKANIASTADVEALNAKITALTARIEELGQTE